MKELRGARAIVTGSASGIGLATARALGDVGCSLDLVDIDEEGLESAREAIERSGTTVRTHTCDLASSEAIAELCAKLNASEAPAILVNNAGIAYYDRFERMCVEEWDRVMRVNLDAPARLVMALLPSMRTLPCAHIVNIASILGHIPKRKLTAYCTSKFGLVGFSLALRTELSPAIGVSVVCPGLVKTGIGDNAISDGEARRLGVPERLGAPPERVAKAVVGAIRQNRRLVMVTGHARAARAVHAVAPGLLDALQMRRNSKRQRSDQSAPSSTSS